MHPGWARKTGDGATVEVRGESSFVEIFFPLIPSSCPVVIYHQYLKTLDIILIRKKGQEPECFSSYLPGYMFS